LCDVEYYGGVLLVLRQVLGVGNPAVATRLSALSREGVIIPAVFKMNQSVSFSTDGVAMEARQQPLGGLLPTANCMSYKRSTSP